MPEVSRTFYSAKDAKVEMHEIKDGIYRVSGFVKEFGITFNQFLVNDEQPTLIHTGPIGMYQQIEQKVKEVIALDSWPTSPSCTLRATNGAGWSS